MFESKQSRRISSSGCSVVENPHTTPSWLSIDNVFNTCKFCTCHLLVVDSMTVKACDITWTYAVPTCLFKVSTVQSPLLLWSSMWSPYYCATEIVQDDMVYEVRNLDLTFPGNTVNFLEELMKPLKKILLNPKQCKVLSVTATHYV